MKKKKLILIGSSTGGPGHLEKILSALPHNFSSTVIIAQHIPHVFLPTMIKSMNAHCAIEVVEAAENSPIKGPIVVFASKNITNLHYNPIKWHIPSKMHNAEPLSTLRRFTLHKYFKTVCAL